MEPKTKNMFDVCFAGAQFLVAIVGVIWVMYRFRRERTHKPRMEFTVDCNFFGPQRGYYVCETVIRANNRGLIDHRFRSILLGMRGIEGGGAIQEWKTKEPRLEFPVSLLKDAEVLYTPRFDYIFVEPGVSQPITYVTRIPAEIRFIVVRVQFKYDNFNPHSAEKVFEVIPKNSTFAPSAT